MKKYAVTSTNATRSHEIIAESAVKAAEYASGVMGFGGNVTVFELAGSMRCSHNQAEKFNKTKKQELFFLTVHNREWTTNSWGRDYAVREFLHELAVLDNYIDKGERVCVSYYRHAGDFCNKK